MEGQSANWQVMVQSVDKAITDEFLFRNGYGVTATAAETVEMVLAVEGDRWGVDEVESWLRERAKLVLCNQDS
jgi:prophage maintenance system killer protein